MIISRSLVLGHWSFAGAFFRVRVMSQSCACKGPMTKDKGQKKEGPFP
jgi:hypothetical protein